MVAEVEVINHLVDLVGGLTSDIIFVVVRKVERFIVEALDAMVSAMMARVRLRAEEELGRLRRLE